MFAKKPGLCMIALMASFYLLFWAHLVEASSWKVLVVMSYEEDNPWCIQIKEGIDSVFTKNSEIRYFYMDTKKNFAGGVQKAQEAVEIYQRFNPDGVIAVDDNAQTMFVLPYLKDKVKTPVMFCGVNDDPQKYGYPASNVSGILERNFIGESIAFAKQLVPSIETVGFLAKDSPSGRAILKQVENESDAYLAKFVDFKLVETIKETLAVVEEFNETCDLLFLGATNGILGAEGKPLTNKQVTQIITKLYKKPIIGANSFHVTFGVLCAVVKSGFNQGRIAAEMLLKAMQGIPFQQLPITVNRYGKRMLNITVMKELGIRPKRRVLVGVEFVKTAEDESGG